MASHYESDPSVPPARVGHLGRHRPVRDAEGRRPKAEDGVQEPGPSYDDFLDHAADDETA